MLRVAVARIPDAPSGDAAAPEWMSDAERLRWAGLTPTARRGFAASRGLLRELLQEATGLPGDAWDVSAQSGHAPRARPRRGDAVDSALQVSLSHRVDWVAAAVAGAAVGVDIECDRPARPDPAERAALMLSPAERPDWDALPPAERASALLARWTAKEAWFKASPPDAAPWDFRRVVARICVPARANVRVWAAKPLHVAVCCADARALAASRCGGLDAATARESFWHVQAA